MKFLNISLSILLVLSFLMIPTCVFADVNPTADSGTITHTSSYLNNINPMVKGSSGGSKSSSSSSKVKSDSDDDSGDSTDDGSGSWIWIIIAIIVIIALIILVWYFLLRNR
jgi:ABC-type transport system involved in multi-copper enzyme maturation permease subunit